MYQVTVHHNDKAIVRGDLKDKFELIAQENFKTREAAKTYIESICGLNRRPLKQVTRDYHKGDKPSYCYWFTGVTWQHENSGEMMEEYYQYTLKKVKLR
jgi:hypothetical protein